MFLKMILDWIFGNSKENTNDKKKKTNSKQIAWSYDNSSIQRFSIKKILDENSI